MLEKSNMGSSVVNLPILNGQNGLNLQLSVESEMLAATLNSIGDAIIATDVNARITRFNAVAEKLTGCKQSEAIGRPIDEIIYLIDADTRQPVATALLETLTHCTANQLPRRFLLATHNGQVIAIAITCSPIIDLNNVVLGTVLLFRDITQRKKTEQKKQIRSDQFESLVNVAPIGIYLIGADFNILQINAYALPVFGGISHLIGRDLGDVMRIIWPQNRAEEIIQKFRHTLKSGESYVDAELIEQRLDIKTVEHYTWQIHRIALQDGRYGVVCYFQDIAANVRAQQKYTESAERYRSLFNSMDEGFCVLQMMFDAQKNPVDFRFLEVNPAFEEQCGLINATGKTITELVPDMDQFPLDVYGQVLLTGEPIRFDYEVKAMDRWFDIYAYQIGNAEENQVCVLFSDVTKHKRAEKSLIESEARLHAFVQTTSDVVYSMNPDWSVMQQLHGRDFLDDINQATFNWLQDYIHPDDQAAVLARVNQAIQTKSTFEMEHRVLRADNSLGWTFSRAVPLLNSEGEITEWFGTASDVTERKLERQALRQIEERFRVLFDLGPVAMYTVDVSGAIQEYNRNAVTMWGREPKRGDPSERYCCAYKIYLPDGTHLPHAENPVSAVLQGRVPFAYDVEAILERQDGSRVSVVANVVPLKNAQGEITGAMNCLVDMTYRKNVEDALFANNLELQAAKLAAEKANLAKSDFLSSMSHELRTPLNSILGFAQLIQSNATSLTPTQQDNVQQILHGGWYVLTLINEILDLAQIESGHQALLIEPVLLAQIMRECEHFMAPIAEKYGIGVNYKSIDHCIVMVDKTRLKQIMINLLSNAIKYNKPAGTVTVDCKQINDVIRISIKDTGTGLDASQLTQLFQPFNRLGQEKNGEEGTGIGLVVCKKLIELMQGKIGVQSTVNQGSEFWIEVKLMAEPVLSESVISEALSNQFYQPS